ncbi:MAG: HDIG domain-containing protein [Bacteroidaceae bacterium]|nr:HDIG domain-containing protein [Bacteroidaceae bacterium]
MIKKIKEIIKKNGQKISRVILIAICAGLIIGFMPKGKTINYDFKENAPWTYEQLVAEFDFDIRKSNAECEEELDSIYRNSTPIFEKLNVATQSEMKVLFALFTADHCEINKLYKEEHIIDDADTTHLPNGRRQRVIVYEEGSQQAREPETINFITLTEAKQKIREASLDPEVAERIRPNYRCNIEATQKKLAEEQKIDYIAGHIKKGEVIVSKNEIINKDTERAINSYLAEKNKRDKVKTEENWFYILLGQSVFIVICLILLLAYLALYKKEILNNANKFIFTIIAATVFPVIVGIMMEHGEFSIFILPFAIVPITLCLFIDHNTAFVTNTISLAMCSVMVATPYEFLLVQLVAGCSAILSLRDLSSRSQMFKCVTITFLTYSAIYLCYEMITSGGFSTIKSMMYIYFVISTVLTLFVYPLMFIIERTFGFISSITLIELSNLNSPLLQRMSQEVPGTFQHSMQVGNLAAEAAIAVGGNPLEARTGALYHDIGKLENPIYFTENQSGGISPHKRLTPIESAQVIIKHVTNGLAIAERENLPKKIKEFITTHHGLSKTGYFYITYKNEHPDEVIDDKLFTYPGPKPFTKEQAVLMMADCVEAASHSIKEYTEENICKLVDNIIDAKLREGELEMAPLTFQDIFTVKEVFKKRLMAIYHTRISYPSEKKS